MLDERCFDLLIPALWRPPAPRAALRGHIPALPALDLLGARGDHRVADHGGDLLRTISGSGLRDRVPFGRLRARYRGDGERGWWCADPVHLAADAAGLRLFRPTLDEVEARGLTATLTDGLDREVRWVNPTHWIVDFGTRTATTAPTTEVLGRGIEAYLPTGPDAVAVRRWMTEAQMLMHEHPVNQRRSERGERAINAVWVWGGAGPSGSIRPVYRQACAAEPAYAQFARTYSDVPDGYDHLDDASGTLVRVDIAHDAAACGDPEAWIEAVKAIEQRWVAPAWDAVLRGDLDRFRVFDGVDGRVDADARMRWRFWRRGGFLEACDDVTED